MEREIRVWIRWMIPRDMTEVIDIESASFEFPWWQEDFICTLRQRNCIGMVAEYDGRVVGFMIYELGRTRVHILNLAVNPIYRHNGVGSQMLAKLTTRLLSQQRQKIILEVRETNLPAQLFFYENGFRAVSVIRNYYADTPEDAYLMQYSHKPKKTIYNGQIWTNRITQFTY